MFCQNNKDLQKNLDAKQGGLCFSILMAFYVILAFVVQSILLSFTEKDSFLYLAVCSSLSSLSIFGVIIYIRLHKKVKLDIKNKVKSFKPKYLVFSALLSVGMFLGLGFINLKINQMLIGLGLKTSAPAVMVENMWQFLFFTITLAVLPAIFEEIFFRGILLNSFGEKNTFLSVLTVSFCFALYHCNLSQFVYQFVYGVAFSFVAIACKSILPCIISHFLNNFIVLLFYFIDVSVNLYSILLIIIGLVSLALLVLMIVLELKNKKLLSKQKGLCRQFVVYALFGIFICLLMIVSALLV